MQRIGQLGFRSIILAVIFKTVWENLWKLNIFARRECRIEFPDRELPVRRASRSRSRAVTCRVFALCWLRAVCRASGSGCLRSTWHRRCWWSGPNRNMKSIWTENYRRSFASGAACAVLHRLRAAASRNTRIHSENQNQWRTAITFGVSWTQKRSESAFCSRDSPPSSLSVSTDSRSPLHSLK